MVAGICNSVGGGFLTCHCGACAEYRWVSRLGLLIGNGNRWMSQLRALRSFRLSWNALTAHYMRR